MPFSEFSESNEEHITTAVTLNNMGFKNIGYINETIWKLLYK